MATEAQSRARRKYQREGADGFSIRYSKAQGMPERIRRAADLHGIGPTTYIKKAIEAALERDGIGPVKADGPE